MSAESNSDAPVSPSRPKKTPKTKSARRKRKARQRQSRQERKKHHQPAASVPAKVVPGEPQQPEPQKPEPQKPEPQKPEPQKPEPQKPEPQQSEPQQSEPQQPEPQQSEPQKSEAKPVQHHRGDAGESQVSRKEQDGDLIAPPPSDRSTVLDDDDDASEFDEASGESVRFPLPLSARRKRRHFHRFRNSKTILIGGVIGIIVVAALAGAFVVWGLPMLRGNHTTQAVPAPLKLRSPSATQKTGTPAWFPRRSPVVRLTVPESEQPSHNLLFAMDPPPKLDLQSLALGSQDAADAIRLMDRYRRCAEWPDKLPLILRHDRSEQALRVYYEQRKEHDPQIDLNAIGAQVLRIGDARIVTVAFPSRDRADGIALAYFHRTAGGDLRLDWESFVGASDTGWLEFRRDRIQEPVFFRGYATLDDYYNYEFADPSKYLSVKLRSPDGTVIVNAFCSRDSQAARFLSEVLIGVPDKRILAPPLAPPLRPIENLPVAVTVRFPASAQSNHCVELLEMVAGRWFLCDNETALAAVQANATGVELIDNLRKSVLGPRARE